MVDKCVSICISSFFNIGGKKSQGIALGSQRRQSQGHSYKRVESITEECYMGVFLHSNFFSGSRTHPVVQHIQSLTVAFAGLTKQFKEVKQWVF